MFIVLEKWFIDSKIDVTLLFIQGEVWFRKYLYKIYNTFIIIFTLGVLNYGVILLFNTINYTFKNDLSKNICTSVCFCQLFFK